MTPGLLDYRLTKLYLRSHATLATLSAELLKKTAQMATKDKHLSALQRREILDKIKHTQNVVDGKMGKKNNIQMACSPYLAILKKFQQSDAQ